MANYEVLKQSLENKYGEDQGGLFDGMEAIGEHQGTCSRAVLPMPILNLEPYFNS